MILAHIIVKEREQTMDIIKLLTKKDLIFSAVISTKKVYEKNKKTGKIEHLEHTLIIGKTKALLFGKINALLKEKYPRSMPMLYAIPIIYMDDELTEMVRSNTALV
jgi:uncharacterized protein involved in tolerance to divalent cations